MPYVTRERDTQGIEGPVGSSLYGVCHTDSDIALKIVDLSDFDKLIPGVTIHVKFAHTNTAVDPLMDVNGTGILPLVSYGDYRPGLTPASSWNDDSIITLTYDGHAWVINGYSNADSQFIVDSELSDTSVNPVQNRVIKQALDTFAGVLHYRGTKPTVASLPSSGNIQGDVWLVEENDSEYIWNGATWEQFGPTIDLSGYATKIYVDDGLDLKVDKVSGKGLSTEDYTTAEKDKLANIDINALATKTYAQNASFMYGECNDSANISNKSVVVMTGDFALKNGSRIIVNFQNANTANTPKINVNGTGSKNIRTTKGVIASGDEKSLLTGLVEFVYSETYDQYYIIATSSSPVQGVKGDSESSYRTGNVNITKANIGLGNVDNTSDSNKPVSTAQQAALDLKVDKVSGKGLSTEDYTTAEKNKLSGIESGAQVNTVTGVKGNSESSYRTGNINITKANIGLGNVDNTSDANKPVSTAQQAALDLKAPLASPALTGTPTAPTPTAGSSNDQIATKGYVDSAIPAPTQPVYIIDYDTYVPTGQFSVAEALWRICNDIEMASSTQGVVGDAHVLLIKRNVVINSLRTDYIYFQMTSRAHIQYNASRSRDKYEFIGWVGYENGVEFDSDYQYNHLYAKFEISKETTDRGGGQSEITYSVSTPVMYYIPNNTDLPKIALGYISAGSTTATIRYVGDYIASSVKALSSSGDITAGELVMTDISLGQDSTGKYAVFTISEALSVGLSITLMSLYTPV